MEYAKLCMSMRLGNARYSADPVDFGAQGDLIGGSEPVSIESPGTTPRPVSPRTAAALSGWIANDLLVAAARRGAAGSMTTRARAWRRSASPNVAAVSLAGRQGFGLARREGGTGARAGRRWGR
jgi:hypothetical protein